MATRPSVGFGRPGSAPIPPPAPSTGQTYGARGQPVQSMNWTSEDLTRRMRIVSHLYPGLKKRPKILMSLASQDIPDDHLVESVTKTAGFQVVQRRAKTMAKWSDDQQRAAWDSLNPTEQKMLKQADYRPPAEDHPGLWEQAFDEVTKLPIIRSVREGIEGDFTKAFDDLPLVPDLPDPGKPAPGIIQGTVGAVGNALGFSASDQTKEAAGGLLDVFGKAAGGTLRDVGLGEVANAARSVSSTVENDVVAPALRFQNTVGGAFKQAYRLDQELNNNMGLLQSPNYVRAIDPSDPLKNPINTDALKNNAIGAGISAGVGLVTGDDKPVKHFLDAWEKTAVGERYFPDRVVDDTSTILDDDPYSLDAAKQLAGGSKIDDIAAKYGKPGSQEYINEYMHLTGLVATDNFQKALHTLENGKVSIGRDVSRVLGVPLDSDVGTVLSGATDALVTWYTDPLIIAGKVREAYKVREAVTTADGIVAAWDRADIATEQAIGPNWEAKLNAGDVSLNDVAKVSPHNATAAEMAGVFHDDSDAGDLSPLYDYFHKKFPQFEGTVKALVDHHNDLKYAKAEAKRAELGRNLTAEELAAVPGIEDSRDIWNFYTSKEGLTRFTSGGMQPGAIGNFYLPSLSRTAHLAGEIRSVMTTTVNELAARGLKGATTAEGLTGVEGMEAAAAAAPAVAPGMTRLYRVEGGAGLLSEGKFGREAEQLQWFNNIERARSAGLGLGAFGQFGYVDVGPDDLAKATDVTDESLKHTDMVDYLMDKDFAVTPNVLGPVGKWAEIDGEVKPAAFGLLAMPARLTESLMARVPTGTMNLWGNDTPTQLARLLDMEYGGAVKGQIYDAILKADSPIVRREMVRSVLDRIGYANGVYVDDVGKEVMEKYIGGIKQRYAYDDIDLVPHGTVPTPLAILPYRDHADQFAMPNWKELGAQSKRMGVLHTMLGPTQAPMWDAVIGRAWKPTMLFRLGFAPRAMAEEALATLLRAPHTFSDTALLKMAKLGEEPVIAAHDVRRIAKGMHIYIPGRVETEEFMDPLEKFAHYLPNWAKGTMRGVADQFLDKEVLDAARIAAQMPEIQSGAAAGLTRVSSSRTNWSMPEDVLGGPVTDPHYTIGTDITDPTKTVEVKAGGSEFQVYTGEEEKTGIYFFEADRNMGDPAMREVTHARNLYVHPAEADALAGQLRARGMVGDSSHAIVRQAIDSVDANQRFANTYREYLTVKRDREAVGKAEDLHAELERIATNSGDANLMAIADGAHEFQRDTEALPLLNRRRVMDQLHRPEPEVSALDNELFGPHLMDSEQDVYDKLLNGLPEVELGKTRVYGRVGARDSEQAAMATVRRTFPELAPDEMPWKYVTTDPNDVVARVMDDVKAAKKGQATHTQNLMYADVPNHELIEQDGQLFLQQRHRSLATEFGSDLGNQLTDIANAAAGVDGNQARRWAQLADRALAGDATAAEELGTAVAERQLRNPKAMRNVREIGRSAITADGLVVAQPLREGMNYVYYPVIKPAEADAAFLAVDPSSSAGRRFLDLRQDLSPENVRAYTSSGEGPAFAQSRYASEDPEEVRSLINQINESASAAGQHLNISMARLELPEERTTGYYTANKGKVGSHDYEMNFAESLGGLPIDLDGALIDTPGVTRAMTVDEYVAEHGADSAGEYARLAEAKQVPTITTPNQLSPGTSTDEAIKSYAEVMNKKFDQMFVQDGRVKHDITIHGAHHGEMDRLAVYTGTVPDKVVGPVRYIAEDPSLAAKIMGKGFDAALTPVVNAFSRTPLYVNNVLRRISLSDKLLRPVMSNPELVEGAANLADKLKLSGGVDELYRKLRNLPESRFEAQKLIDEGKLSSKFMSLTDDEWELARSYYQNENITRHTIGSAASEGALADTIPYISDHHVRSQFAEETRNVFPFWWAQEAFFRRWAGTISHTPEAIRKAQLIMQGARHAGIIHKDEEGKDTLLIPGSNVLMGVLQQGVQHIFGDNYSLPVPVGVSGEIRMAVPGFDAIGVPGAGPLVGLPLATARRIFPEIAPLEKGILGEKGAGRNPLEQIFPAFFTKLTQAFFADVSPDTHDAHITSASVQAMQYLEANGHGLPDDATPEEQQQYIERVTHWARSLLVSRAVFGYIDPAPVQLEIGDVHITKEFQDLLRNVGLENAISEMVKLHPDATATDMFSPHHDVTAYSTFGTKSLGGNTLPQTAAAEKFMQDNREFIKSLPLAAAWMLPQSSATDENVRSVHALQLELGLRAEKTPKEWYGDFKFAQGADVYFKSHDDMLEARAEITSSKDRAAFDHSWSVWKKQYLAQHPVFAQSINDRSGVKRRVDVMDEMHRAFEDPKLPDFPHKAELKTMVESYTGFKTAMGSMTGQRGTKMSEARKELNKSFARWARDYVTMHPEVKTFYQRIIYPDITLEPSDAKKLDTAAVTDPTKAPSQQQPVKAAPFPKMATKMDVPEPPGGRPSQIPQLKWKPQPGAPMTQNLLKQRDEIAKLYGGEADITMKQMPNGQRVWVGPDGHEFPFKTRIPGKHERLA